MIILTLFPRFGYGACMLRVIGIVCALFVWCIPAFAGGITEVVSTSPAWTTFTQRDGTGLYHEVLREVFALYDISVRHEYAKSIRSENLVISGQADMMTCSDLPNPALVLARYPLYKNDFFVFFRKDRIGPWKGVETLRDKEVLHQPTFYTQENFPVPVRLRVVSTGAQAVDIIDLGRSDFYVDDMTLIKESLANAPNKLNMDEFDIKRVGRRAYFPQFNTSERGKAVMKMYEEGIITLHKAGKLKPIYEKWGHQYPRFDEY